MFILMLSHIIYSWFFIRFGCTYYRVGWLLIRDGMESYNRVGWLLNRVGMESRIGWEWECCIAGF